MDGLTGSSARFIRYSHNDMLELDTKMSNVESGPPKLVVSDGVFSMSGAVVDLPELMRVSRKHGAMVYLDEAHSIGTLGATGAVSSNTLPWPTSRTC